MDEWVVWLVATIGSFLMLELPALFNRTAGDTLSEHVWKWLRVKGGSGRPFANEVHVALAYLFRVILGVFLLWLTGHLTMGWWS